MTTAHEKLARILHTKPEIILNLEERLTNLTGKAGIFDKIAAENEKMIGKRLVELGLTKQSALEEIRQKLEEWVIELENKLSVHIGNNDYQSIVAKAVGLENPGKGLFIKRAKAFEMLENNPPQNILNHFGYGSVGELVEKEGLEQVYSALRFIESSDWMNNVFIKSYSGLTGADFEERPAKVIVLEQKWLAAAEKFLQKKYHNVSHLKELGVIFIIPITIDTVGELMRVFTLLLHYLNEVPFYSKLFKKFSEQEDFSSKLKSLLRGDVPEGPVPDGGFRIIQRYLAKDDKNDFRLLEPHINPEAEHWHKAESNLNQLSGFEKIMNYDFVGDYFGGELVSFGLIDLVMSLVKKGEIKYLYHQQEALWNKIFIEYFGRDKISELVEENIIQGFINF